jgi:hypothetical protein
MPMRRRVAPIFAIRIGWLGAVVSGSVIAALAIAREPGRPAPADAPLGAMVSAALCGAFGLLALVTTVQHRRGLRRLAATKARQALRHDEDADSDPEPVRQSTPRPVKFAVIGLAVGFVATFAISGYDCGVFTAAGLVLGIMEGVGTVPPDLPNPRGYPAVPPNDRDA